MLRGARLSGFSVCLLSLVLCSLPALASTIRVPQDQPTIQAGIDAANAGDTVLVAPGTYGENIDFKGKAITVTSSGGAAVTIIDGGAKPGMATVQFRNGETSASVLSNFTIRGGGDAIFNDPGGDGGVYIDGSSPTIRSNIITANYCHNIDVEFAAATIVNNEVSGVLQSSSTQNESYCTFGSGIFLGGTTGLNGLGTTIIGNAIENNLTGSGINMWAAQNVLILNNIIRNNTSPDPGSAFISANSGGTVLVQNLIYGNTSTCGGALGFMSEGFHNGNPSILIANNTIVDNVTPNPAGGSECIAIAQIYPDPYAYGSGFADAVIINNIISGSTAYPAVNCGWYQAPSLTDQPVFQNDILNNAAGPFFGSYCIDVSGQDNNITSDPQFIDRAAKDYHLKSTSPAIDAGENSVLQTYLSMTGQQLTTDFDGNSRVQNSSAKGCLIDIGAYEYPGNVTDCGTLEKLTSSANPSAAGQTVTFTAQLSSSSGTPTGSVELLDGGNLLDTQPVSGTGSASFSVSALSVGTHTMTANFQPTGSFAATAASLTQVVTGDPTNTAFTCTPNPATTADPIQLQALVTSSNGTPDGIVTFYETNTFGDVPLVDGKASLTISPLAAGMHNLSATYTPPATSVYSRSIASCQLTVNSLPSTAILEVTPQAASAGSPITLTAIVASPSSSVTSTPTGSVNFTNAGLVVGTATLAAGSATTSVSSLPVGSDQLSCQYSGDNVYAASSCNTVPVTISGKATVLTLSSSNNPARAFQPVNLSAYLSAPTSSNPPAGSITFFSNGTSVGSATLNAAGVASVSVNFPAGSDILTATYAGSNGFNAAASAPVTEVIAPDLTTTSLTASPDPAVQNTIVTLAAQVSPASSQVVPTGTVNFFDGANALATVPVDGSGHAVFATSALTAGVHSLLATYNSTANDAGSTSLPMPLTVLQQDFTVSSAPSLTIATEHHAELSMSVASLGNFTDTIELSCSNLPEYATCDFAAASIALDPGASLRLTVHIDTDAVPNFRSKLDRRGFPFRNEVALATLLPFACFALRRRKTVRITGLLMLLSATLLLPLSGCSSLYPPHTAPGEYTVTLTGSGVHTSVHHSTTFTLNVTP